MDLKTVEVVGDINFHHESDQPSADSSINPFPYVICMGNNE